MIKDSARIYWEIDLGRHISDLTWEKLCSFNGSFSLNVSVKEQHYKLLHRWYLTPSRLSKIYPEGDYKCWKCDLQNAPFIHMWWMCKKVQQFWRVVQIDIQKALQIGLPFVPELFVLGLFVNADYKRYKYLIIHLLTAASTSLTLLRKDSRVPMLGEWCSKVYYLCLMSRLSAHSPVLSGSLGAIERFRVNWRRYINYAFPEMDRL